MRHFGNVRSRFFGKAFDRIPQGKVKRGRDTFSLRRLLRNYLPKETGIISEGNSLAKILYTGGTMGLPKGVPITHYFHMRTGIDLLIDMGLWKQIDDIALDTDFNGIRVLSSNQTVTLQTGAEVSQTLNVTVKGAKTNDLKIQNVAVSTITLANTAISTVDTALQSVSSLRADLGAFQNRLEFTISTLAIQEENAAASESAIRDADVAQETIKFTRNQILVSAGTSVLAQANVLPQTALQLLG